MNYAHLHIAINHFPVMGSVIAFFLLVYAVLNKTEPAKRISLAICVLVALATVPVYLTGDPAEHVVEHLPGVSEELIEHHEESALPSLIAVEVLGIAALAGLLLYRSGRNIPRPIMISALLLSVIVVGLMGWTANLGGQIRHPEARAGFKVPAEALEHEAGEHD